VTTGRHAGHDWDVVAAATELAAGRPVVVVDDLRSPWRAELFFAAGHAGPAMVSCTVRHSSGFLIVAVMGADAERLDLPPMWWRPASRRQLRFTVTVDGVGGITSGVSAADRARTLRIVGSGSSTEGDLRRPGHVAPVCTAELGTLQVLGVAEAAWTCCASRVCTRPRRWGPLSTTRATWRGRSGSTRWPPLTGSPSSLCPTSSPTGWGRPPSTAMSSLAADR
jgi:3,4-dihydroxy-2-butanone 4-phosphate synthase